MVKRNEYELHLDKNPYEFVTWLSEQFDIDTPQRFQTVDDINRGLEVLTIYAQSINYLEEMSSFCKLYCRELKRLGESSKEAYEDMVDRQNALDNKLKGLKTLYQALNKNITLLSEQLKRIPENHTKK